LDPHSSPDALTKDLIRNSYEIVKAKYTKKR
jgi:predicted DNA-binding protein (MmcQ/YjbR family)